MEELMTTFLLIVSIILIIMVLLQSGKAEGASQVISGGNSDLFNNRKERGAEVIITRVTFITGFLFFAICLIMAFM